MSILKAIILFLIADFCFGTEGEKVSQRRITNTFYRYLKEKELPKKAPVQMTKKKFKKLALDIAKSVDTSKADIWASGVANENGLLTYTRDKGLGEARGWLAVRPGDIIYYEGAFGLREAMHLGIYIGQGCIVEMWKNPKTKFSDKNGVIVLNVIEHFKTSAKSMSSIYKPWTFLSYFKEKNSLKKIDVLDEQSIVTLYGRKIIDRRREIITKAASSIGSQQYSMFEKNCQSFCMDIVVPSTNASFQIDKFRSELIGNIDYDRSLALVTFFSIALGYLF
jgi:hypothetical protein